MTTKISAQLATAVRARTDDGMTTAEYAVGTVSACGFAGVLYEILTSEWGSSLLQSILDRVVGVLPF
jgi:hypothetical protein